MSDRLKGKVCIITGTGSGMGRVGLPEDIAPLALYLASDESSWVTGADYAIDGSTTAW